jgi:nucleotide-binding universal stress UspA family protein
MNASMVAPTRIVIGLDGSPGSARALSWVIPLARTLKAEIIAVHAYQIQPYAYIPAPFGAMALPLEPEEWLPDLKREFDDQWCAPLKVSGIPYQERIFQGSPAAAIIDTARQEGAGMIVVGSRGLGGFKELMLGSVSHQLAMQSEIPVIIVPGKVAVNGKAKPALTMVPTSAGA